MTMPLQLRKILFQVFMDQVDEDGHITQELHTEEPEALYAHELDALPERVEVIVRRVASQLANTDHVR